MNDWEDILDSDRPSKNENGKLIELLNKFLRNWYWFVLCGAIGLAIAYFKLHYSTPIYKVNAKVLVLDGEKGGGVEVLGDISGLIGRQSNVDNEVEVLRTHDLMRTVVDELRAYITFKHKGRVRHVEVLDPPYQLILHNDPDSIGGASFDIYPLDGVRILLEAKNWQKEVTLGERFEIAGVGAATLTRTKNVYENQVFEVSITSPENRTSQLQAALAVTTSGKQSSTIDLSTHHAIPKKGVIILQTLLDKYVIHILEDKNKVADSTLAFIAARLNGVSQDLGRTEDQIKSFKQQERITDISDQSQILLANASSYTRELAETEGQLMMLDELDRYLADPELDRVLPTTVGMPDAGFSALVQRYNALILDRERLLLSHTEDNPYVINLDGQITGLRNDMRSSLRSSRQQIEITRRNLERRVSNLDTEIRKVPATERDFIDLSRQQQIKQELYIFLQQKWEETAIGKTANIPNVKVIDSPRANKTPVSPKRNMALAVGLLLGLAVPFILIGLRELFNVRIRAREDIQTRTDIPLIATIGHSTEDGAIVVSESARNPVAEQFRTLRTNLSFFGTAKEKQAIMTTSSMSGEGKSFIAVNLAISMALTGKKVALLELDLRKPALSSKLGLRCSQGFTNYIVNSALDIEEVIHATDYDNLSFVSSGPIPPNPAEMLLQARTKEFFASMAEAFDVLIIDTAPIGLVTDAQLLDAYADICLYIVRQDVTYKRQLEIPEDLVRHKKINNLSLILNDAKIGKGYGYQGYGYGYGYYGKEEKRNLWKRWWRR